MFLYSLEALRFVNILGFVCAFFLLTVTIPGTPAQARISDYDLIIDYSKPLPQSILDGNQDLPVLVNTGIESCPPCRRMASILLEMKYDYGHIFETHYYDTQKQPDVSEIFQIRVAPTQIFFDRDGNELHRNEGFLHGDHIIELWNNLGLTVEKDSDSFLGQVLSLDYVMSSLTLGVQGAPITAMLAAFVWGMLSVMLSPCHLAGIPLIIGYINVRKVESISRAFFLSLVFALGILISILIIGIVTTMAGRLLGDLGPLPYYLVGGVLILFGLNLTGLVPLNTSCVNRFFPGQPRKRGALILGIVLGIGLGPCTFIYIAPILGVTLALSAADVLYGFMLVVLFGLGHCLLLVLAGISPRFIESFLRWNEKSLSSSVIKKICGGLLLMGGAYVLYWA